MKHCTPICESKQLPKVNNVQAEPTVLVKKLKTGTIETCLNCNRKVEYNTYSGFINVWNYGDK